MTIAAAELLLDEAVDDVEPPDRTDAWRQAAAALAEILVERGAIERAAALLDEAETPASDGVRTRIAIARGRSALLAATGRPADGAALLAEATGSALATAFASTDGESASTLALSVGTRCGFPPRRCWANMSRWRMVQHRKRRTPVEQAVDVFVYAPLGLVLEARA